MLLLVGGTGRLGGAIARLLLADGRRLRLLVRRDSPSTGLADRGLATDPQVLMAAGAEPAYGDLKDPASLEAACEGVDTVVTTANSAGRQAPDTVETVDLEGNRHLIDAARHVGVRQFVFVSAQLAHPASPMPFFAAKGNAEEYLQASGVPYTILAPAAFMEVWVALVVGAPALAGRSVVVTGSGARKHSFISSADVARFAVASLGNGLAINRRLVIGGPEPLSFRDAAQVFARVLGREVPVESVAPGTPVPHLPPFMSAALPGFDLADTAVETFEVARAFGVTLTPLEQFARRMAGAPA